MMQWGGCCDVPASITLEGFDNLMHAVARVTEALHVSPPPKPRPWQGASPCSTLPRAPNLRKPPSCLLSCSSTPLFPSRGREIRLYTARALPTWVSQLACSASRGLRFVDALIQSANVVADQTRNSSTPCRSRPVHP